MIARNNEEDFGEDIPLTWSWHPDELLAERPDYYELLNDEQEQLLDKVPRQTMARCPLGSWQAVCLLLAAR